MSTSVSYFDDYWALKPVTGVPTLDPETGQFHLELTLRRYPEALPNDDLRQATILVCTVYNHQSVVVGGGSLYSDSDHSNAPRAPDVVLLTLSELGSLRVRWNIHYANRPTECAAYYPVNWSLEPQTLALWACDLYHAAGRRDLWESLYQLSLERSILRVQLGDQIYADDVYQRCVTQELDAAASYLAYQTRYERAWATRAVLQSSPGIMLPDDHEVTNDYQELGVQNPVIHAAEQACLDYQYQLNGRTTLFNSKSYYVLERDPHAIERAGVLVVLIYLESTTFDLDPLLQALETTPHAQVQHLVLCFNKAPVVRPEGVGTSRLSPDRYFSETLALQLYQYLFELNQSGLNVVVAGGDCHYGSHRVLEWGLQRIHLLTASPLTNQPGPARWWAAKQTKSRTLGPYYERVVACQARRCYVRLDFTPSAQGVQYLEPRLVWGSRTPRNPLRAARQALRMRPN